MERDERILRKIKAAEEMERLGYKKKTCPTCKGNGHLFNLRMMRGCTDCEEYGYIWEAPREK